MAASLSIIALSLLAGSEPMASGTAPRSEGVSAGVTAPLSVEPSALNADALANLAGGSEPSDSSADPSPISVQVLTASNTGNSINAQSVSSGYISISGSALSNATGIGNYVFNTGHNNNLQGSITVNVIMGAPTLGNVGP